MGEQMGRVMQAFAYCSVILLLSEEKKSRYRECQRGYRLSVYNGKFEYTINSEWEVLFRSMLSLDH